MPIPEEDFQAMIIEACRHLGIEVFHPYNSRGSEPGFPDLTLVGSNGVMFRELKSERGEVSKAQTYWLAILTMAGQNADVWRPHQWPDQIFPELQALGRTKVEKPPHVPRRRRAG